MTSTTRSLTSPRWRFEASLAVTGLFDPPLFPGGPWSSGEVNAFHACAAQLAAAGGSEFFIDSQRHDGMEATLNDVRARLLRRDPRSWPDLAPRRGGATPVDFSILVGWGARCWFHRLNTRRTQAATLTQIAAVRIITAVDRALARAAEGGLPACRDRALTRQIGVLFAALSDLLEQPSAAGPRPAGIITSASMRESA